LILFLDAEVDTALPEFLIFSWEGGDTGVRGAGDGDGRRMNGGRGENSRQDGNGGKGALHYFCGARKPRMDTNEHELFYRTNEGN
jgi:hypothetical protein